MSSLESIISAAVEAAREAQGLRPEAVCVAAGMSRATYYNRLSAGGWRVTELEGAANLFGVPLTAFFVEAPETSRMVKMNWGPMPAEATRWLRAA